MKVPETSVIIVFGVNTNSENFIVNRGVNMRFQMNEEYLLMCTGK
jgi:hypothetical protein